MAKGSVAALECAEQPVTLAFPDGKRPASGPLRTSRLSPHNVSESDRSGHHETETDSASPYRATANGVDQVGAIAHFAAGAPVSFGVARAVPAYPKNANAPEYRSAMPLRAASGGVSVQPRVCSTSRALAFSRPHSYQRLARTLLPCAGSGFWSAVPTAAQTTTLNRRRYHLPQGTCCIFQP